jgi:prepilin signal peptidase PulO-like enzyme (type II secretory pathway)
MIEAFQAVIHAYPWFLPGVGGLLGGVFGSFGACMWYRMRHNLSLRQPPSFCPACGHQLEVIELIPIFSWMMLRGRCRKCHAPIGWQALLWEIVAALLGIAAGVGFQALLA